MACNPDELNRLLILKFRPMVDINFLINECKLDSLLNPPYISLVVKVVYKIAFLSNTQNFTLSNKNVYKYLHLDFLVIIKKSSIIQISKHLKALSNS